MAGSSGSNAAPPSGRAQPGALGGNRCALFARGQCKWGLRCPLLHVEAPAPALDQEEDDSESASSQSLKGSSKSRSSWADDSEELWQQLDAGVVPQNRSKSCSSSSAGQRHQGQSAGELAASILAHQESQSLEEVNRSFLKLLEHVPEYFCIAPHWLDPAPAARAEPAAEDLPAHQQKTRSAMRRRHRLRGAKWKAMAARNYATSLPVAQAMCHWEPTAEFLLDRSPRDGEPFCPGTPRAPPASPRGLEGDEDPTQSTKLSL